VKRVVGLLLILVLLLPVLGVIGCTPTPTDGTTPAPSQPAGEVLRFRLQTWAAAADLTHKATERYAATVQSMSNGRLVLETFPAGGIVPVRKEHEALMQGTVEAIMAPDGWMESYVKASYLFSQYVAGPTGIQLMLWDRAGGGRELSDELVKDYPVHFVGPMTVHPAEVWAHTNKPINTVADLQGMKLRMGSAPLAEIFTRIGAAPVVLSGAEIYESAQRGVIDGFEYVTPSVNWSMGFQEVAEYVYMSPVRAPADRQSIWMSDAAWAKLSPDLRDIVVKATEALVPLFFAETIVKDAEALVAFEAYGCKVLPVPEVVDDELKRVAAQFFDEEAAKDPFFAKVLASQRAYKAYCEAMNIQ